MAAATVSSLLSSSLFRLLSQKEIPPLLWLLLQMESLIIAVAFIYLYKSQNLMLFYYNSQLNTEYMMPLIFSITQPKLNGFLIFSLEINIENMG